MFRMPPLRGYYVRAFDAINISSLRDFSIFITTNFTAHYGIIGNVGVCFIDGKLTKLLKMKTNSVPPCHH